MSCTRSVVVRSSSAAFPACGGGIGKIPLAQHILAVQLEAALAQAEAIGQRLGRMPHREISQHKRFGFAHQLNLPRGAAGASASSGRRSSSYSSRTAV